MASAPLCPIADRWEPERHRAFAQGAETLQVAPTRFYLNLTDRCQLRCRHCITRAPDKTASGSAQDMPIEVLSKLEPYIRNASYVALCHAGEPTVAPGFWPLLKCVAGIPFDRRPVLHLLTNGSAIDRPFFEQAVACGLRSLCFSIDGLTEKTHDSLRIGSRIGSLVDRIKDFASIRDNKHLPVRIGVSWTIHAENLSELPALPERAAQWGLDSIKLEEMHPANSVARKLALVAPSVLAPLLRDASDRARGLGINVVDHTSRIRVWRCQLGIDRTMSAFSRSDDFANHSDIDPCRAPYDTVHVDCDGSIKARGFDNKGAGNVLERPLMELWNTAGFRTWRRISCQRRRCLLRTGTRTGGGA